MNKNYFLLSLSMILISLSGYAQEETSGFDGIRKNAISFNILGTTPTLGIIYDRIVSEKVSLEIGAGIPSVGVGFKYYPWKIKESKLIFHVGLTASYVYVEAFDFWGTSDDTGLIMGYLPIGMSYFGKHGFNLGVDIGPAVTDHLTPYGNLKVGYRF